MYQNGYSVDSSNNLDWHEQWAHYRGNSSNGTDNDIKFDSANSNSSEDLDALDCNAVDPVAIVDDAAEANFPIGIVIEASAQPNRFTYLMVEYI